MKRKSSKIYLIASVLIIIGIVFKLSNVKYDYIPTLTGMALGIIGLNTYLNEIKKEQ